MGVLDNLTVPVVLAPMAGGPATVELAVAVSEAGGLGFLAAGYRSAEEVEAQVAAFRAASARPFGVNLFVPPAAPTPPEVYADYVAGLRPEAERVGAALGEPRSDDDAFAAKVEVLLQAPPAVVSFVFGCPSPDVLGALQRAGAEVMVTVTTPEEASAAVAAGADGLVVQGSEAGGHRGSAVNEDQPSYTLIALLQLVAAQLRDDGVTRDVPLIAAGGITTGAALAAALAAGAAAGQVGTAFLLCPEAGTAAVHREAVATAAPTAMTRAFTGKPARGIVNRFLREHTAPAPAAYPEIHHVTAPVRAAARAAGDPEPVNLWAGQAHRLARPEPAEAVVLRLAEEAAAALGEAVNRLLGHA